MKTNDAGKLIKFIQDNDIVSISRFFESNPSESTWLVRV